MTIIDFIRLIIKHIVLLITVPILLSVLVLLLTLNPSFEYSSQTILYTGLASGSSIEMDKTFNFQATNTAFDNLINIIDSRETKEEVAIRLLALHLMLPEANSKYISKDLYDEFKNKIPVDLYNYIDSSKNNTANSTLKISAFFPKEINIQNYEKTVQNLTALMNSSNDNYLYELLNYDSDDHYSLKAISQIKAQRISNSDLIKLTYTVNDPGICQQTLSIYSFVCSNNYKIIKENSSDAVVQYFEAQLSNAKDVLKAAEEKLLEFNKSSNIINYYEQSKAVAVVKEDLEVDFKNKKARLAGLEAATKRLEEKLKLQDIIQEKSNNILKKKEKLGNINFQIALKQAEIASNNTNESQLKMAELKNQSDALTDDIKKSVDELYTYQNTIDGMPISKLLPDWMNNVVESDNLKAQINVINGQNDEFQKVYAEYAPAGSNIKRIEREISVAEQGYLEILHGLNLAKLKFQDNELSSNIKTIDTPFYPLSPNPTKRTILIIAAGFLGGILTLGIILVMEYFDDTLKNSTKASEKIGCPSLGMTPKIILDSGGVNLPFIQKRLIAIITQNILQFLRTSNSNTNHTKTIVVFSTQNMEGKTVIAGNIAKSLEEDGNKVVLLNFDKEQKSFRKQQPFPIFNKILGYPDPRIDYENSFLAAPDISNNYNYKVDNLFYNAKTYNDLLAQNNINLNCNPDYVIIEIPAIIYNNYPSALIANSDLSMLVCRSNRTWSRADQTAITNLEENSASKIRVIVNGVNLNEVESILGDLPKNRSQMRKKIKEIFKFQFLSKSQI